MKTSTTPEKAPQSKHFQRGWQQLKVVIQMVVYAGFPAALNGMTVVKEGFAS